MKITKVEVFRLPTAQSKTNSPIGCRIYTDTGLYGDGEAGMAYGIGGSAAFGMVCDLAELVLGMDPLQTELIWETMYKKTFWGQNGGPVVFSGIAAIDVALWDIKGKYFNVPVYQLLGGKVRDKLRTYASQLQFGWRTKIEASDIHARLGLQKGRYILLSAHREENIDTEKNFTSLFTAINRMAEKYDMPILYSCHPRSRKRLEQSGFQLDPRVIQHEPLGFHDYNCLQMNAFCVVSDSGTLPEESSFFTSVGHPFPAVCIRTSTERPEALDKGCFILAGIDEKSLLQAVDTAVEMNQNGDHGIPVPDYVEENVSTKVVKIIQSYTGVVNKMVWRKG